MGDHESIRIIADIERWFRAHDDGEFVVLPAEAEASPAGDWQAASGGIYCTKPRCVSRICEIEGYRHAVALFARPGLPSAAHVQAIQSAACAMWHFYGDADPVDLMVFSWLRAQMPIIWSGVSDSFLERIGVGASHTPIRLSESEQAALTVLPEMGVEVDALLGPTCAALLRSGFKVELEGAVGLSSAAE